MASFFPDDYIESVYDVNFKALFDDGYRVVLFDVDNTLVPHNAPSDDKSRALFKSLSEIGFKTALISNNKEPRVQAFCNDVKADSYTYLAKKPKAEGYLKMISLFQADKSESVFFGDQVFTDVWGAKNAGISSILVKPIKKWHEEPQIVAKRFLEALVLTIYKINVIIFGVKKKTPILEEVQQ